MPLVASSSASSSVMNSKKTCFVCYTDVPVKNHNNNKKINGSLKTGRKSQRKRGKVYQQNERLCQRFGVLASRYLELPVNDFKPEETLQLRDHLQQSQLAPKSVNNNNNQERDDHDQSLSSHRVCDRCLPMVESFCQIYHEWQSHHLQLNWRLQKISEVMTKNKNRHLKVGIRIGEIEAVKFRTSFAEKVDQRKRKALPKVSLSDLEIEDESDFGSGSDPDGLFTPIVKKKSKPTVEDDQIVTKMPIAGAPKAVDEAGRSQPPAPTQAETKRTEDDNESITSSIKDSKVQESKKVKEWISKVSTVRPSPPPYDTPVVDDKTEKSDQPQKWSPVKCDRCHKQFRYSRTLRDHQKQEHEAELEHSSTSDAADVTEIEDFQVEFEAAEEEAETQQRTNQMNTDEQTDGPIVREEEPVEGVMSQQIQERGQEQAEMRFVWEREQIDEEDEEEEESTHSNTSNDDDHPPQLSEEQALNHP